MPDDTFKLQMECKGCGKLLTFRVPGTEETEFETLKDAGQALAEWAAREYDPYHKYTQLFTCPTCKRAYRYSSFDVFIAFPPSTDYPASSVIDLPMPD